MVTTTFSNSKFLEFILDDYTKMFDINTKKIIGKGGFGKVYKIMCHNDRIFYAMKSMDKKK